MYPADIQIHLRVNNELFSLAIYSAYFLSISRTFFLQLWSLRAVAAIFEQKRSNSFFRECVCVTWFDALRLFMRSKHELLRNELATPPLFSISSRVFFGEHAKECDKLNHTWGFLYAKSKSRRRRSIRVSSSNGAGLSSLVDQLVESIPEAELYVISIYIYIL